MIGAMFGDRIERWERAVEWPLMIAACLFLIAYAVKIVYRPTGVVDAQRKRRSG